MKRIAVIFDHLTRPDTTGIYCLRALANLAQTEHFHPCQLDDIPRNGVDLYLFIDDGLSCPEANELRPQAFWAIDTHISFPRVVKRAATADCVFAAQREGAVQLAEQLHTPVDWLPLACDPDVHGRQAIAERFDVCFVGNLIGDERIRLVRLLQRSFGNTYVGRQFFEEMARVYSSTRIVFNRSVANDINMRVFEALCSGSLLVTNGLVENGQDELFQDGRHLVTYREDEELLDKIRFYLAHDEARQRVAAAGSRAVRASHTYLHRMQQLISTTARTLRTCPVCYQTEWPPHDALKSDDAAVIREIPATATRILHIGCGDGTLGRAIKARQPCQIFGIDIDQHALNAADAILDRTWYGDVEEVQIDIAPKTVDVIVCSGVLELVRYPLSLLERVFCCLGSDGCVVLTVSTVHHHSSPPTDGGIRTPGGDTGSDHHLFTLPEIERLLFRSRFAPQRICALPDHREGRHCEVGSQHGNDNLVAMSSSPSDDERRSRYSCVVVAVPANVEKEQRSVSQASALSELRRRHLWPATKPHVDLMKFPPGWMADGARTLLQQKLTEDTWIVVELGAWLGLSTRFIAGAAPNATVIAVDHWRGNPEHQGGDLGPYLGQLADAFLNACFQYRDRVIPMRCDIREGLQEIASIGVEPDLIYVDGDHSFEAVRADIDSCRELFPRSLLVGDDFSHPSVCRAVREVADEEQLGIEVAGEEWQAWSLPPKLVPRRYPIAPAEAGTTSVAIVAHNQLAYTRLCLESIRTRTTESYEIVVVDNGSTDGTTEYLRQAPDVRLIVNAENRGFPAAVNQAVRAASGGQILLLNNDCVVTTGWLTRMLRALYSSPGIGLVGPCSNEVSGRQRVVPGYTHLSELDDFAWEWGIRHHRQFQETIRLVGFCLLIKRKVIDQIGLFDESFGIGNFEDDDFCHRASAAGYKGVIARDTYVHHFGGATFRASEVDYSDLMERNRKLFESKWPSASRRPATDRSKQYSFVETSAGAGLRIVRSEPLLSVCMIVRDSARTLDACLSSVEQWVDEIVVVDTGSLDQTPDIARNYGAKVFQFPWCDDFSAARNESLRHATGEWLFWMDSDDTIDVENGRKLRALAYGQHARDTLAYVLQVHCPHNEDDEGDNVTVVDHVKLFRNLVQLRFEGRIHEQILPAINRLRGVVKWTDIVVSHSGSDRSQAGQELKLKRDLRLLQLEEQERPEHPFTLFNLGMTYLEMGQYEQARRFLERTLLVAGPQESHVPKAFALLIQALTELGRHEDAWQRCQHGLHRYANDPELLFRAGVLAHHFGRFDEAERYYLQLLATRCDQVYRSIDRGICGYKARHNLASVYMDQGRYEAAEQLWQVILKDHPSSPEAWRGLITSLLQQDKAAAAAERLSNARTLMSLPGLRLQLDAQLDTHNADYEAASAKLEQAVESCPHDFEARNALCRLLFEHGDPHQAERAHVQLAELRQDDPCAHHNLGQIYLRLNRLEDALEEFRAADRLRPNCPDVLAHLALAHELLGDIREPCEPQIHPRSVSSRGNVRGKDS